MSKKKILNGYWMRKNKGSGKNLPLNEKGKTMVLMYRPVKCVASSLLNRFELLPVRTKLYPCLCSRFTKSSHLGKF